MFWIWKSLAKIVQLSLDKGLTNWGGILSEQSEYAHALGKFLTILEGLVEFHTNLNAESIIWRRNDAFDKILALHVLKVAFILAQEWFIFVWIFLKNSTCGRQFG